jgi:signal transduction histidine kinase/ActR/RegA family two-component response regulator
LQPQGSYESSAPSGESTIVFFARSSLTGWSSHVAIPRSIYDAPFLRYRAFLIAAGLLALFVTGCFVWLLKRENDARLVLIAEREHERRLEALGRVASSVAHDFNNLLTAVQGSLALLRRGQRDTDRGDRMIEIAKMAVERGANLTSQLLSFSRKDQFEAQPVDLNEEFGVVANLLANMLGDRVSLTWRVDEGASGVMADRAKLTATLLNLCTNARDAMPDGGEIELTASGREGAADGSSMVVIRVRDSGLGMSPDVLRRAIEPFFSTKGNRGTGLGLATAVSFARQSGGDLAIDSAPGRGTTVELTLPHAILEHGTTVGPLVGRSAPLRILAVDDDPLVLVSTVSILEEAGHFVRSARSAEMAITVLSEHHFDLVITDVRMPGIGGAGLVRAIRGEHSQVAVLVFSGYPDAFDAREAGVPFLRKPATADEIRDAIDLALRSHETQWEARRDA